MGQEVLDKPTPELEVDNGNKRDEGGREPSKEFDFEASIGGLDEDSLKYFPKNEKGDYEVDVFNIPKHIINKLPDDLLSYLETSAGKNGREEENEIKLPKEGELNENDGEIVEWEGISDFSLSKKEFESLSPETQEKLDGFLAKIKDSSDFIKDDFKVAYGRFMEDPFIQARIDAKNGKFSPQVVDTVKSLEGNKTYQGIVANLEPAQVAQLNKVISEQISGAMQVAELGSEQKFQNRTKVQGEIQAIMNLDKDLQTDKDFSDPEHPLADFFNWYLENSANINLLAIGGPATYSLYLQKTGKMDSALKTAERRGAGNATRILRNAGKTATTLNAGVKSTDNKASTNAYGVDEERFKKDLAYQNLVFEKYSDDPKVRALMEQWAYN